MLSDIVPGLCRHTNQLLSQRHAHQGLPALPILSDFRRRHKVPCRFMDLSIHRHRLLDSMHHPRVLGLPTV